MTYEQTKQGKPLRPEKKLTNSAKRLNNMVRRLLIHHGNFDFRDLLPWAFASTLELLVVSLGERVP